MRGLEGHRLKSDLRDLNGFSPLPGFEGSGGAPSEANVAKRESFSPLPGFEGSGGVLSANGRAAAATVSVPFRGLRGLEGVHIHKETTGRIWFQSPSGV